LQDRPDFLGRKIASALHEFIGYLGPAVGEAVERIVGSVFNQVLFGERDQLSAGGSGKEQRD
jgi:hypothetical protein